MTDLIEPLVVAALVLASALYSAWKLMSLRQRLSVVDAAMRHAPPESVLAHRLARLRTKLMGRLTSGCSACSSGDAPAARTRR